MQRILVLVCALAAPAWAGPPRPQVVAAQRAWKAAEAEENPRVARGLWREAARAYDRAVLPGDRDDAYSALLAWKNARSDEPPKDAHPDARIPFDADDLGYLHALAVYMPVAPAGDAPAVQFLRGDLYYRHRFFDEAERDFAAIIAQHPEHDAAEYSANLMLDSLARQNRYADVTIWVEKLRANDKLLAGRGELHQTLQRMHDAQLRH